MLIYGACPYMTPLIRCNKKIVEYLPMIGFYHLPLNYLNDFIPHMESITKEQINEAFRQRIKPETMLTLIVGPKQAEAESPAATKDPAS